MNSTDSIDLTGDDPDERLMAELRALARLVDPVPAALVDAARATFTWRTIDAELAELAYDSLLDEDRVPLRGAASPRLLTFELDALTLEVEVTGTGRRRRLLGQLVPPQATELDVLHADGTLQGVAVDELGRFSADGIVPGPLKLRWKPTGSQAVETAWVSV